MRWSRIAFALMLIFGVAPAVSVAPINVLGQGYTTFTTETMVTGFYTYSSITTYQTGEVPSYVGSFAPMTFELNLCGLGAITSMKLAAVAGIHYRVEWETRENLTLNFYITTDAAEMDLDCNPQTNTPSFSPNTVVLSKSGRGGAVDWVAPRSGQFIVVLMNLNPEPVKGLWSVQKFAQTVAAYVSFATSPTTQLIRQTFATEVSAMTAMISQGGLPFGNLGLLLVGVAVAAIAGVLVVARRRKPVAGKQVSATKLPAGPSISTGYVELDSMIGGGLPERYAVVLVSQSFDERDLLIRKTVESSLAQGRPTFYLSNEVSKTLDLVTRFHENFYALNPMADKIASGVTNLFKIPDVGDLSGLNISSNQIIASKVKKEPSKMIIIELLTDLLLKNKALTTRKWLTDFVAKRKAAGFTILATLDPSVAPKEDVQAIIGVFDGVIEVYERSLQERSRRFLVIKKMYGRDYSESELMLDKQKLL